MFVFFPPPPTKYGLVSLTRPLGTHSVCARARRLCSFEALRRGGGRQVLDGGWEAVGVNVDTCAEERTCLCLSGHWQGRKNGARDWGWVEMGTRGGRGGGVLLYTVVVAHRSARRVAIGWDNACLVIDKAAAVGAIVVVVVVMVVYVGADASERECRKYKIM